MNVGEWLAMQAASLIGFSAIISPKSVSVAYIKPDGTEMIEIAPHCYLNRRAYELGIHLGRKG